MMKRVEKTIHYFTVGENEGGIRLDLYLAARNLSLSRSQIKRAIDHGQISVNDTDAKPGYHIRGGDRVRITIEPPRPCGLEPEEIPLTVVFEDEFLVVVNKPAGMVVHPGAGNPGGTLVNALLAHCDDLSGIGGYVRPGIVHRLDKDTSGLIVVAKTDSIHRFLADQFKERRVTKIYQAIVHGVMRRDEGVINAAIGRHPVDRKKMSTASRKGKTALTRWIVRERFNGATCIDASIETGRTHQIRVHLSAIGHPLVGDSEYGGAKKRISAIADQKVRAALSAAGRQALHAGYLSFYHPHYGTVVEFSAPLPADMRSVLEQLRAAAPSHAGE